MESRAGVAFIGRARELWELERALAAARTGSGSAVLIAGEAGIGKTRLASELAIRARAAECEVLIGRAIDLVGTDLPYQPFVEALRPLGGHHQVEASSQLRVFEETLALLTESATASPVLLVLEDLHWADTSTLDLAVYLAHNIDDQAILLVATCRADEPSSAERVRRLSDGVRRSGSGVVLELGPLDNEELAALLAAHAEARVPTTLTNEIVNRSEGNPFFAEELLAAAHDGEGELPRGLRDLFLQRVSGLDDRTRGLLRLTAAAGRDVSYSLLRAAAGLPEADVAESLRVAVEQGVLVADQNAGSFRLRHALLAEAIYATILPGEREELHARLAEELSRIGASPAEVAPHWAAAGSTSEAFVASIEAAREAEEVFGLPEAVRHLERALTLWDAVPNADAIAGLDLAELCSRTAELASEVGAAARALELGRRAAELVGGDDPHRAAILLVRLGEYLEQTGREDDCLAAIERAAEIVPAEPPSPERAFVLGSLAGALGVAWRHTESLSVCEEALALARSVGAQEAVVRALTVLGSDLAYLGRGEEGVAQLRQAVQLAEEIGDRIGLDRAYIHLTDVLTMLGRHRESTQVGQAGLEVMRRYGIDSTLLVTNQIEALLASGDWDEAERVSAAALRGIASSFLSWVLTMRAAVETGRGDFDAAGEHFAEALVATLREDRVHGIYDVYLAELALWQRRWIDAVQAVCDALSRASRQQAAQLHVWFSATGLRAHAELVARARARRDEDAVSSWLGRAKDHIAVARRAAEEASAVTPNAGGWLAQAEAEYERTRGVARPESWSGAATIWEQLERPPLAAYCRWREAEALVTAGASRTVASMPLRAAHSVATRLRAQPLLRELELLAERARLDLAPPETAPSERQDLEESLGLTPREAEVLTLVARGYTNREIAETLVISIKTASVHVSHILSKLGAPNRVEAAAIAHRLMPASSDSTVRSHT